MATESGLESADVTSAPAGASYATRVAPDGGDGSPDDGRGAASGDADPRSPLATSLREQPTAFEFFQAVRVLERLTPGRTPVGGFGDPAREVVRFRANVDFGFPAAEIQSLVPGADDAPPEMTVNFMGLTGPEGVLPLQYSALVAERVRAKDTALRDFLDLFNHRVVSLFYRAWEKYRFAVGHERDRRDRLTQHLLDLVGIGTGGLQDRLPLRDEALLHYGGLLLLRSRPAAALEALVADYFDVPAEVEQFVGAWYTLDEETCTHLGDPLSESARLGTGAVVGDETWDQQSRIRLRLGPLTRRQFDAFLPTGSAHEPLRALVAFYAGDTVDAQVRLVLARDEVNGCTLDDMSPLGWGTWLTTRPARRDPDETVLTL